MENGALLHHRKNITARRHSREGGNPEAFINIGALCAPLDPRLRGDDKMNEQLRKNLIDIFQAGLHRVHGRRAVQQFLCGHVFSSSVYVISIGKAAVAMAEGALEALGDAISDGLVITKEGHGAVLPFRVLESAHPMPDVRSIEAGEVLLQFIRAIPRQSHVLFLLSGGASALVEVLPTGMNLKELQKVYGQLIGSGLSIREMNRMRSRYSQIKGGKLAQYLKDQKVLQLCISDIPGDDMQYIGSGPLLPSSHVESHIVASLQDALEACSDKADELGYTVEMRTEVVTGDAEKVGRDFAKQLIEGKPRMVICGGETTVRLPKHPGCGGRNQHLALCAATVLSGYADVYVLAAGTDGTDGPGEYAGALVDGGTIKRGIAKGFDAKQALQHADSSTFLAASGDLIKTGPTGTNVMDVILGLRV